VAYTKGMARDRAARTLILCTLLLGVSRGHAEVPSAAPPAPGRVRAVDGQVRFVRRAVAVVDLSDDPAVREAANRLLDLLASHTELGPPAISDGAALVDPLPPDDELRIGEAEKKHVAALAHLARRNFREAAINAVEGQELLHHVSPRAAIALYAELALALGQSRLGEQRDAEAREAFALAHRLDPRRTLDDLHYLPEVVRAFELATQPTPGTSPLSVRGVGQVWIDGEEAGAAPGEFRVAPGRHVVWLTGLLRETLGAEVATAAGEAAIAAIPDGPLTRPQKVARYRLALAQASDPPARAAAMQALATFVSVHDAVLLQLVGGKVVWQTWRDRAPWFSGPRELRGDPIEVLRQVSPPKPVDDPDPPPLHPLEPSRRWYQSTPVKIGLAATVALVLVGGYAWARYTEPARAWNIDIKSFAPGGGP
jgi:hypothetical protein